jgi:predicted alpha/beta-fold hydrolase
MQANYTNFTQTDFHPRKWMSNGHVQTIMGNILPRPNHLPTPAAEVLEVTAAHGRQIATHILCECHWQLEPVRKERPTVLLVHGLEGSSSSQYVIGNANKLWFAGCNVVRMNMRNCGGRNYEMAKLTPTLYHSGLSGDIATVVQFCIENMGLSSISIVGYSMGGNLVLKYAGEQGANPLPQLRAIVGVSPAVDLAASADALHERANRFYERRFLRALLKRFRRKAMLFPRAYDPQLATAIGSLRDFDHRITALYSGFRSADDYYYRASCARVLDQITIPTLLIHASDDPFIRFTPETRQLIETNPHLTWLETGHGGHCAFLAQPDPTNNNDGYWAEHTAMRFILDHA